jgi:hypothetical protein
VIIGIVMTAAEIPTAVRLVKCSFASEFVMRLFVWAGVVALGGIASAADQPVDWSMFVKHAEIGGVVVKADKDKIVLDVPTLEKKQAGNNNNNNNNNNNKAGNRGGRNRRPSLTVGHEHVDVHYAAQGMVRYEKVPEVTDGKGGTTKPTGKELDKLRLPLGAPGYAAERTDLRPGHIVAITLVRPSTVTAEKASDDDILIKYAIIKGITTPPKDAGKDDAKKKKKD